MKNVTIGMLLLAMFGIAPLTGCVVHEREHDRVIEERHDAPRYDHRDDHPDGRHDDVHVDVHP